MSEFENLAASNQYQRFLDDLSDDDSGSDDDSFTSDISIPSVFNEYEIDDDDFENFDVWGQHK